MLRLLLFSSIIFKSAVLQIFIMKIAGWRSGYPTRSGTHNLMDEKTYLVYILESLSCGKFYIGYTDILDIRFRQHNERDRKSWTSKFGPWKIIYTEKCESKTEALKLEKYLKSLKNRERIKQYIAGWRSGISGGP